MVARSISYTLACVASRLEITILLFSSAILHAVLGMKYQRGETQQSCSVGNIPDSRDSVLLCWGEIQYSENGIEIGTEDAVGNHVADGVAVTQRSN